MNYPNWSCGSNQEHLDVGNEDDLRKVAFFFFSSRRRHTRFKCDWSSDVCSSDLLWKAIDEVSGWKKEPKALRSLWASCRAPCSALGSFSQPLTSSMAFNRRSFTPPRPGAVMWKSFPLPSGPALRFFFLPSSSAGSPKPELPGGQSCWSQLRQSHF